MRASTLLFITLMMIFGCAAQADLTNWAWGFGTDSDFQDSGTVGGFGVRPTSLDGYDSSDGMIISGPKAYFGTYHVENEQGWTGDTGFYRTDLRSPNTIISDSSETWIIYVWADPTLESTATKIGFSWTYSGYLPPSELDARLILLSKPEDVTGGPDIGTIYNLSQVPGQGINLPVFRTSNGLEGYKFAFTVSAVPEPSSILALVGGIAGLGGFALRRRRS